MVALRGRYNKPWLRGAPPASDSPPVLDGRENRRRSVDALKCAAGLGRVHGYKNGRGVIGSLAAAAWRPRDRTYEIFASREVSRWGTPRQIDPESVIEMDREFPSTF